MHRLQESLSLRFAGWILFLIALFTSVFYGCQTLIALPYVNLNSIEDTDAFYLLIKEHEDRLIEYTNCMLSLEQEDLSYVEKQRYQNQMNRIQEEMQQQNTNFRFRLLSWDGSQVVLENVGEGIEEQVQTLFYATFEQGDSALVQESYEISADEVYAVELEPAMAFSDKSNLTQEGLVLCYGVVKPEWMTATDDFSDLQQVFESCQHQFTGYVVASLGTLGIALLLLVYLLWGAGYQPDNNRTLVASWQDRVFLEFWLLLLFVLSICIVSIMLEYEGVVWQMISYMQRGILTGICLGTGALVTGWGYFVALFLRTVVVRCKTKILVQYSLIGRVIRWIYRLIRDFFLGLPLIWKVILGFCGYVACVFMVDYLYPLTEYAPVPGLCLNLVVMLLLCRWAYGFWKVRRGAEIIAAGNLNHRIETERLPADLKRHGEILNNISNGLTCAMDEKMKSERFKAELITNVSHDLKTPLTSIINYVNLLKTTEQTDPKALEYIEVLERKSQRLRKLTEDLVEASKASTGVLKVNRERIGMGQLLDQALGEYEEKLQAKQLQVVCTLPEGESYVYADGRHLWRVIDNLLGNCSKYALEGTRVYIEVERAQGSVSLSIKNISREPLNIPPERLMERFVRGEESRTTEGSGLGLSIAKNLTELQGGTFQLVVDGDLFKAIVTVPQAT